MTTYKSKIGLELVIPLLLLFGGISAPLVLSKDWFGLLIIAIPITFLAHLFVTTYYVIEGEKLTVKCSFIINQTIAIKSITKITETNNMLSSPATSLDRIEIVFGTYDSILISPKNKTEFIQHLTRINPQIEVHLKKR